MEDRNKFLSKVNVRDESECWNFTGNINPDGYGRYSYTNLDGEYITVPAHRLSFSLFKGELIAGLVIDHECRNRACVNPSHLRQVTRKINAIENNSGTAYQNSIKTHCPKEHEYTKENTITIRGRWRKCRICEQQRQRINYLNRKQE